MIICIQLPRKLLMMQDQKSLMHCWVSCSELHRKRVLLVFSYQGGRCVQERQWHAKVNILRLALGYPNATINRKTRNTEPEIGTDGSSQIRQNAQVDRYGSTFGPPRRCRSCFRTVVELNRTIWPVRIRSAGGLPGPVVNSSCNLTPGKPHPRKLSSATLGC